MARKPQFSDGGVWTRPTTTRAHNLNQARERAYNDNQPTNTPSCSVIAAIALTPILTALLAVVLG